MDFLSFFQQKENKELLQASGKKNEIILSGVGNVSAKAFLIADFCQSFTGNTIVVLNFRDDIKEFCDYLHFWIKEDNIFSLALTGDDHELHQRVVIEFMHRLYYDEGVFILSSEDFDRYFPSMEFLKEKALKVGVGDNFRSVDIFNTLIQLGYELGQDIIMNKGEYRRSGGILDIFPVNGEHPYKIEIEYEKISNIWLYDHVNKKIFKKVSSVEIFPLSFEDKKSGTFIDVIPPKVVTFLDELDDEEEISQRCTGQEKNHIIVTSFPRTEEDYFHLRYLSVLKFYNLTDLINDLREKVTLKWKVVILSKRSEELKNIFTEEKIPFSTSLQLKNHGVFVIKWDDEEFIPMSFQNPILKIQLLTDKEIFSLRRSAKNKTLKKLNLEFLASLKEGDFVVHLNHGIGRFIGIAQKVVDEIAREYLEILYAENDKLFVPIDQADKVSKFISSEEGEENEPRLSRLGSQEWKNMTKRVKKETEKIAKELLVLYANRAQAKGFLYSPDSKFQSQFEDEFPYKETPGQIKAIQDIKQDMESHKTMDRLICGDVGFGKTEVAMRATFKASQDKKQVAFISPITILADQHYRTLRKRMAHFGIKVEMLSRFRTQKEQQVILKKLRTGDVDVVVGTHRLLQPDIKFLDLGLVIIDEEQRFGVKQKETLKDMRSSVDVLTLTATPIPRTLNLSLNKLRDITIISTPPPGRLPIITEVRKYSDFLVREAVMKEMERNGQIYFLHNRVETIDGTADKLRHLIPEARIIVAHGQLGSGDLEERIMEFKEHKHDVLVSSTIIENGIDLANANTLIVNNAERFGLSQLYQLRGRIGRGKKQAYAYFLYHTQKLRDEAKKRLRAIVEASELGAGFQIAMRDLEIRGAGEILGVGQHGMMNVVGVGHFIRLLNQTIEEIKTGRKRPEEEEHEEFSIELPVEAYIPSFYISDTKEKISAYQKLSAVDNLELLEELKSDLIDDYGDLSRQVSALFDILDIKLYAKKAGLTSIKTENIGNKGKQIVLNLSDRVTPKQIIQLINYNDKWKITGTSIKIDIKDLGFQWLAEVKEGVKKLTGG